MYFLSSSKKISNLRCILFATLHIKYGKYQSNYHDKLLYFAQGIVQEIL